MAASLIVEACGPGASLQDAGRIGSQRYGVSRSGAMDRLALAHANTLVGNPPGQGAIEFTLLGGRLQVRGGPLQMGVAGATMPVSVDGVPVPPGTSATLEPGQSLAIGPARSGVFGYLAVGGGLAVASQLGSVSLQPRAGIGGLGGRALQAGDELPAIARAEMPGPELFLSPPPFDPEAPIRVVLGPQADHFDEEAIAAFLSNSYAVSTEADRMGYRLSGPVIQHLHGFNIVSDGIVAGSVQVPGSGVPIVMMADHQTTGGYPKIATVISTDLRLLAQRRTGGAVRFEAISVADAQALARARAAEIVGLLGRATPARGGLPAVEALLALNLAGAVTNALAPTAE